MIGVLVRRWGITGTLGPLRALTRLTLLSVATNALIGIHQLMIMVVFGARDLVLVMVDVCVCQGLTQLIVFLCMVVHACLPYRFVCAARGKTGTLDPVRGLFRLTQLYVNENSLGGMSIIATNAMVRAVSVAGWGITSKRPIDIGLILRAAPTHKSAMLRCGITGTLEPVRNLTGLIKLYISVNTLGGMAMLVAV